MRRLFVVVAAANLAAVGWVVFDETVTRRPWKAIQADDNRRLAARGERPLPVEIRQLVVPPLGVVDRCPTCHAAIDRPGWEQRDLPDVLRSHPRRDQLLGPHPPDRFGCTPCHDGQGPQTKGVARAAFAHGRDDPYWERPLLSRPFIQASCAACHDAPPDGAELLAEGQRLFAERRCNACHLSRYVAPPSRDTAPPLVGLRQKSSRAFVERWLADPQGERPGTQMPRFWPPPVDGDGHPSPPGSPAHQRFLNQRSDEVAAIADYLGSLGGAPVEGGPLPALDDPARIEGGRRRFDEVGCRGCHRLGEPATAKLPVEAEHGPRLDRVGEKVTAPWLAAWLRGPHRVWSGTRMPDLRLDDEAVGELVAFLVSQRRPGAPPATASWSDGGRVAEGRKLVLRYGCTACHEIPELGRGGRPGPDLDAFGDKTAEEITFGAAHLDCGGRSRLECWAVEKSRTPRRFAGAGVLELAMPDFALTDDEALALGVFLVANRTRPVAAELRRLESERERQIRRGDEVVRRYNCRGCHELGRRVEAVPGAAGETVTKPIGGHIRSRYAEAALAPPPLTHVGAKLDERWLADFLRAPTPVRPWLAVRMPTFPFAGDEIEALARGFAARNEVPFPDLSRALPALPAAATRAVAEQLFARLQCRKCHPVRDRAAGPPPPGATLADLAPDLALVPTRLRPAWVTRWLREPQRFDPETRMPTYFLPVDEDAPEPRPLQGLPEFLGGDGAAQIETLRWLLYPGPETQGRP